MLERKDNVILGDPLASSRGKTTGAGHPSLAVRSAPLKKRVSAAELRLTTTPIPCKLNVKGKVAGKFKIE